ncbi:MAG: AAA family ATPase [Ignavibacteriaceae bacterium]|nr:AAA family ATPase [Ignavibacteriaceae bacterium]
MKIYNFRIENFKSIKNLNIHFDPLLNVLTGVNNSGKTTVLEAIALWSECFEKLISRSKKEVRGKYSAGDYFFGSVKSYFDYSSIFCLNSPNPDDIFYERIKKPGISLSATLKDTQNKSIKISFKIKDTGSKYLIEMTEKNFDYNLFNQLLLNLPNAIETYFSSPIAFIEKVEQFATDPQVRDLTKRRKSASVIRNRIYKLYQTPVFSDFQRDLSYILYNNQASKITINNKSDIQKDQRVLITYTEGSESVEKDISLLGSGTIQCMEILLNFYRQTTEQKDLNLILLDEPDSHIHRDIQRRLIEVLLRFSKSNQLFITTHNESLIKNTPLKNLFHLDNNLNGEIYPVYKPELSIPDERHYKGLVPSPITPIIKSLGYETGLDIINAVESDKVVFVEGEDDARVYYKLLQEFPQNHNRKISFWVLGGIGKIFDSIHNYKQVFSSIKNDKSIWDKSILIFDNDDLIEKHKEEILRIFSDKLKVPVIIPDFYTLESVLLSDFNILARLIFRFLLKEDSNLNISENDIYICLKDNLNGLEKRLREQYDRTSVDNSTKRYCSLYAAKLEKNFSYKSKYRDELVVSSLREQEYKSLLQTKKYYKLAKKEDIQYYINSVLANFGFTFDLENDFYKLIALTDKSTWFPEWDFLRDV